MQRGGILETVFVINFCASLHISCRTFYDGQETSGKGKNNGRDHRTREHGVRCSHVGGAVRLSAAIRLKQLAAQEGGSLGLLIEKGSEVVRISCLAQSSTLLRLTN